MVITVSPFDGWGSHPWRLFEIVDAIANGNHRFEGIQISTGIARNILTDHLKMSVHQEILEKREYSTKPKRFEYHLTEKGRELVPIINAIREWSNKHRPEDV
jgi:DNA-binding HxlR family transcriptional regulator